MIRLSGAGLTRAQLIAVARSSRAAGAGLVVGVLSGTGTRDTLEPLADVVLDSVAELPAYLSSS